MKNLITSLKKLGKKMTGDDVAGSDLVTVVDNIANGYTGGGGGGGGMVVNISETESSGTFVLDKTYAEIAAAANENIIFCLDVGGIGMITVGQLAVYGVRSGAYLVVVSMPGLPPMANAIISFGTDSETGYPTGELSNG